MSRIAPRTAASREPASTAVLASSTSAWSVKARSLTSIDTVKPMPARAATATMSAQVTPAASDARVSRVVSHAPPKMPIGLPRTSPAMMPSATGSVASACNEPRLTGTPAANNAKIGTATHADHGSTRWDQRSRLSFMSYSSVRTSSPKPTPAMVACTPDCSMHHQAATAIGSSHQPLRTTRKRCSNHQAASSTATATSQNRLMPSEKKTAITRMAPRSSTMARVSKKARTPSGSPRPTTASTASAKAMSVAMGIAHPAGSPAADSPLMSR
ncbi:Uncharacterised protein [Mycobacteroides abscessus subsp. abscessus]|nr:Uncharacterised protein [Mycobacteroides abscessus subsp. abscessus]